MKSRNFKLKILAATALAIVSASPAAASAESAAPLAPLTIEAQSALAADEEPAREIAAKPWSLIAIGGAALGLLLTLLDFKKLWRTTRRTVVRAAKVTGDKAAGAVRAVAHAVSRPLRFVAVVVGLWAAAFLGVALFDLEWIAGLIIGGAIVAILGAGAMKMRSLVPVVRAEQGAIKKSVNRY